MKVTLNQKANGYHGIWYFNQESNDEYVYKYSGGLGTYCAKHKPFAVYCSQVEKTFFCYGGSLKENNTALVHMVSYYDHKTGTVPQPTILLDKETGDAHDNPVIAIDEQGYIWIFSTSHGIDRPSYIHRSSRPYNIDEFEQINAVRVENGEEIPFTNFSYMQVWHQPERGFAAFLTHYHDPAIRTSFFIASRDGIHWSQWKRLAAIEEGHYQVSCASHNKLGAAFNFHPADKGGLNWRTNLYYMETTDSGESWHSAEGTAITVPVRNVQNPALVHDYTKQGLNVYMKDIVYDKHDRPIILYITSRGYESSPKNDPRTWTTARWTGSKWDIQKAFTSDNNYDMGSLYIEDNGTWIIIGPTETGPQPYNPGGEIAMWESGDKGKSWKKVKQLTNQSAFNHTYARRPVNANPEFYAFWADGHGRRPSESNLYFCDKEGNVYHLPREMKDDFEKPKKCN